MLCSKFGEDRSKTELTILAVIAGWTYTGRMDTGRTSSDCIGLSRYTAITTFSIIAVIAAFCRISPSILNRF